MKCNLGFLPDLINRFERQGLNLMEQIDLLNEGVAGVKAVPGEKGKILVKKLDSVLNRNPDLGLLKEVTEVLRGNEDAVHPQGMSPGVAAALKFAPTKCRR